jgi:hypothetical protein
MDWRAAFTAIRCSHVEKRLSPRNEGRARKTRIHASWAQSWARSSSPAMRRTTA